MLEDVHAQVDFENAVSHDTDVFQAARKARRRLKLDTFNFRCHDPIGTKHFF